MNKFSNILLSYKLSFRLTFFFSFTDAVSSSSQSVLKAERKRKGLCIKMNEAQAQKTVNMRHTAHLIAGNLHFESHCKCTF